MATINIEVKGVEFGNKGAELMLHSIIKYLDSQLSNYNIILTPGYLSPYKKRATLGAWQKFSFQKFGVNWAVVGNCLPNLLVTPLKHFGIIRERDIDVVLDASGFIYSDQWPENRIYETYKHIKRIEKFGTKYIFLPQTFGPFNKPKTQMWMGSILEKSELIVARDEESLRSLKKIKNQDNIISAPDITILNSAPFTGIPNTQNIPNNFACIIPNSKLCPDPHSKALYLSFLRNIIDSVHKLGVTPVLLNHAGTKDTQLCVELLRELNEEPAFYDDLCAEEIKYFIGQSTFCISSRFHGCISALSQGVPTFATSWSHKYEQLYLSYDIPEQILQTNEQPSIILEKFKNVVAQRKSLSEQLLVKTRQHQKKVNAMWQRVFDSIETFS